MDRTLHLLFAPRCAACDGALPRPSIGPVCGTCWRALPRYTPSCIAAVPPEGLDWLRSLGPYEGSLRAILHALKYDGRQTVARRLATELRPLLADISSTPTPLLVPVPLHATRRLRRGFNQAELLARALAAEWPVSLALDRSQAAATQTRFGRHARQENVSNAFSVRRPSVWRREVRPLADAHVVLVDDVVTTGATLSACAAALRTAGVTRVGALTAARTERRLP